MTKVDRYVAAILAANAVAAGVLFATPARAEDATSQPDSGLLQEVVVTAEKRETTASKTPIAMDVFSATQIQEQGVHDLGTLSQVDPSLQFASTGIGAVFLTMRGVSSRDSTEIGDPAVPVGIDGFFQDRTYSVNEATYDLERIEVLRGPQGTLYGRNAIGGVVNFITQRPTQDYEGYGTIDYGSYGTLNTQGAVNIPLSDAVQVRASWGTFSHDGYRSEPLADGAHYDDDDSKSGRISVAFEPFDGFTGLVYGQYLRSTGNGAGYEQLPYAWNGAHTDISHNLPAGINSTTNLLGLEPFLQDLTDYRLHWEFKLTSLPWGMAATYLGGYDKTTLNNQEDLDNLAAHSPAVFRPNEKPVTQNQELRLASANDQRLTWQTGLFYFSEANAISSSYNVLSGAALAPGLLFDYPQVDSHSYAVYGQAAYKILDDLSLSLGGRETYDDKSRDGYEYVLPPLVGGTGSTPLQTVSQSGSGHWARFTWHAGLDFTPTDRSLIYAKVDTGYKAGGFNSTGTNTSNPYGPETAINYEAGVKQGLFDNKVRMTADVFYEDYKGYQATLSTCPTCNTSVAGIQNAGSARIEGVEWSADALLGPLGKLNLSVDYLSAIFTRFDATLGLATPTGSGATIPVNLAGNTLIQSPHWSMSGGFEHNWDLPNAGLLTTRIQTSFRTAQYFSNYNFQDSLQGAYTVSDAFIQYAAPEGRYSVQAYVHNLENSVYFTNAAESGTAHAYQYAFGAPRTFGIKLTAYFR
jgi:iron complex outermembrane receptor protein